ncbi:hypothetical protein ACLK2B_20475 [Escherichia coli]
MATCTALYPRWHCTTSAVSSSTPRPSTPSPTRPPTPTPVRFRSSSTWFSPAYSARNRSASIRIPVVPSPKARRIEVRFPDPAANPVPGFCSSA